MVDIDNQPLGVIQAVNKTTGAFTAEDRISIQLLAAQAGVAIQRHRLQTVAREEIRLMREMELARDVQNRVIPKSHPIVEGLTAVGKTVPASMTGGDCFDLWKASDGRLGLFLGDARSHGLPAALVVSQARSVIRALTTTQLDPCKLLSQTNALLWDDYGGDGFTTAFLGFLAPDGWLTWSSAGQGPIYIRQSPGATLQVLNATATPLATLEEMAIEPSPKVRLNPGGMLTVTSDGIFEARNAADELFEISRLSDLLNRQVSRKPHEILSDIFNSVNQWQPPGEPRDDQTVIVAMVERAV
jgi:serine phosphatase RsbU (regulator of sigma subunit)